MIFKQGDGQRGSFLPASIIPYTIRYDRKKTVKHWSIEKLPETDPGEHEVIITRKIIFFHFGPDTMALTPPKQNKFLNIDK